MYEKYLAIGRLTRDPSPKIKPDGTMTCMMNIAVDTRIRREKTTKFITVFTQGKTAEHCDQYLSKGSPILVEGTIMEPKIYAGRDGQPRAGITMFAYNVTFLPGGPKNDGDKQAEPEYETISEDEIPF